MKRGSESLNLEDKKWMLKVIDNTRKICWSGTQIIQLDILQAQYEQKEKKITLDEMREHLRLIDTMYE